MVSGLGGGLRGAVSSSDERGCRRKREERSQDTQSNTSTARHPQHARLNQSPHPNKQKDCTPMPPPTLLRKHGGKSTRTYGIFAHVAGPDRQTVTRSSWSTMSLRWYCSAAVSVGGSTTRSVMSKMMLVKPCASRYTSSLSGTWRMVLGEEGKLEVGDERGRPGGGRKGGGWG